MHHIWPHLRILSKHTTDPDIASVITICLACYKLAFLSDIFYRSREVCVVNNESVSIFEYENQAGVIDKNALKKIKKREKKFITGIKRYYIQAQHKPNLNENRPHYPLHHSGLLEKCIKYCTSLHSPR